MLTKTFQNILLALKCLILILVLSNLIGNVTFHNETLTHFKKLFWNQYLRKFEICRKNPLKNRLIYFKHLKIVLNMISECILCITGFQMTYRTRSYNYYALIHIYIIHTSKNDWWQGYFRVCFQTNGSSGCFI